MNILEALIKIKKIFLMKKIFVVDFKKCDII